MEARKPGEDFADILGPETEAWMKVLMNQFTNLTVVSQTQAIKQLDELLTEHQREYGNAGESLRQDLVNLEQRLEKTEREIANYIALAKVHTGRNSFNTEELREHIV